MKYCMNCMEQYADELEYCPYCRYAAKSSHSVSSLPPEHILAKRYLIGRVLHADRKIIRYIGRDEYLQCRIQIEEYFPADIACRGTDAISVQLKNGTDFAAFQNGGRRFVYEVRRAVPFLPQNVLLKPIDLFQENQTLYAVYQYPKGETLQTKIAQAPMQEQDAIVCLHGILPFLSYLHENQFLMQSFSPQDVLITEQGQMLLTNVHNMIPMESAADMDMQTSNPYLPTEAFYGTRLPASDVYGAAALLYTMLTGAEPSAASDRMQDVPRMPFLSSNPVSDNTKNAVLNALQPRYAERTQTIADFSAELLGNAEEKKTKQIKPIKTGWRLVQKIAAVVLIGVILGGGVLTVYSLVSHRSPLSHFSTGENQVKVPNIIGKIDLEARKEIEAIGLIYNDNTGTIYNDSVSEGVILNQSPRGGIAVEKGAEVLIYRCAGSPKLMMPQLQQLSKDDAADVLADLLTKGIQVSYEGSGDVVIGQNPAANSELHEGDCISVMMNEKVEDIAYQLKVPELLGVNWEECDHTIWENCGFIIATEYLDEVNQKTRGIVMKMRVQDAEVQDGELIEATKKPILVLYLSAGKAAESEQETQKQTVSETTATTAATKKTEEKTKKSTTATTASIQTTTKAATTSQTTTEEPKQTTTITEKTTEATKKATEATKKATEATKKATEATKKTTETVKHNKEKDSSVKETDDKQSETTAKKDENSQKIQEIKKKTFGRN